MAHLDNRSVLQFAHITLLGMGIEILDSVNVKGHELAVSPIGKMENGKHPAITIMVMRNGKPVNDGEPVESAKRAITQIVERRHPSERESVQVDGLTITMRPEYLKAEGVKREKARKIKEANARDKAKADRTANAAARVRTIDPKGKPEENEANNGGNEEAAPTDGQ